MLFEWSMVEFVEHYLDDERLQMAYLGQGVIGTNASPHDPGTASIHFHHHSGRLGGMPGMWGYVEGGMGMVSFLLCDAAARPGPSVATGVPVARIVPGEGVELEGGERIDVAGGRLERRPAGHPPAAGRRGRPRLAVEVEAVPIVGCTVKLNVALRELPDFTAGPGSASRITSARSTPR